MNHVSSKLSVYYFVENICQVLSLFSKSYEKVSKEMLHQVNHSLLVCGKSYMYLEYCYLTLWKYLSASSLLSKSYQGNATAMFFQVISLSVVGACKYFI